MFHFYLLTTNHKVIGWFYFVVSIFSGFVGFLYSVLIRLELNVIGMGALFGEYQLYNSIITSHGLIMIFAFVVPLALGGFGNYFIPVILGIPDMLFSRINCLSFWLYALGSTILFISLYIEEGIGLGWTLYPPLSCADFSSSPSTEILIWSIHLLGLSSVLNSINITGTALISLSRQAKALELPLICWGSILSSFLLILIIPVLACGISLLLLDRILNCSFFDSFGGGDSVLFLHLFWFFGHPEVYIVILPIFGFISASSEISVGYPVFHRIGMIYSMLSISFLGFLVWAHHLFTSGLDISTRAYFGSISLVIGVPTSIKIFNWIHTQMCRNKIISIHQILVYLFIFMFIFGGITGFILANASIDILLHDTYFVVAHFHYVLSLGAVVGLFCAFFLFYPKLIGLEYNFCYMLFAFSLFFWGSKFTARVWEPRVSEPRRPGWWKERWIRNGKRIIKKQKERRGEAGRGDEVPWERGKDIIFRTLEPGHLSQ